MRYKLGAKQIISDRRSCDGDNNAISTMSRDDGAGRKFYVPDYPVKKCFGRQEQPLSLRV